MATCLRLLQLNVTRAPFIVMLGQKGRRQQSVDRRLRLCQLLVATRPTIRSERAGLVRIRHDSCMHRVSNCIYVFHLLHLCRHETRSKRSLVFCSPSVPTVAQRHLSAVIYSMTSVYSPMWCFVGMNGELRAFSQPPVLAFFFHSPALLKHDH